MLYVLYGSDTATVQKKSRDLIGSLLKKKPDATLVEIDAESFEGGLLPSLLGGQGLFEHKLIVHGKGLLSEKEIRDEVLGFLKECAASENVFVFSDTALAAATKKKVEKYAEKSSVHDVPKVAEKVLFNAFAFTDAVGEGDKRQAWVLFAKARRSNISAEELFNPLLWQVKSMLLAAGAESATAAGINPFVYKKSRRFAERRTHSELTALSRELTALYHDARRGIRDLEVGLERFILNL